MFSDTVKPQIVYKDGQSESSPEVNPKWSPPGGWLQYRSHKSCLLHVSGWDMSQTKNSKYSSDTFFSKMVYAILGSSYHSDVFSSIHLSDKFGLVDMAAKPNSIRFHGSVNPSLGPQQGRDLLERYLVYVVWTSNHSLAECYQMCCYTWNVRCSIYNQICQRGTKWLPVLSVYLYAVPNLAVRDNTNRTVPPFGVSRNYNIFQTVYKRKTCQLFSWQVQYGKSWSQHGTFIM